MKKRILNIAVVAAIFTGCSKDDMATYEQKSDKNARSSVITKKPADIPSGKEYTEQLPYLDAHTDFMAFNVENDLGKKMNDPKIDWKTINALYNSNLNTAEKQHIIYILFAKKDLLGIQNSTPDEAQANLIADYTKELVNTKYIGYCLLYNALATLNRTPEYMPLVKDLAKQVATYSAEERFHSDFLNKPEGRERWLNKVKEDYAYLDKIKNRF